MRIQIEKGAAEDTMAEIVLSITQFRNAGLRFSHAASLLARANPLRTETIDMCINSCMLFDGPNNSVLEACSNPKCGQPRFRVDEQNNRFARKKFTYISLIDRLVTQLQDPARRQELRYSYNHISTTNAQRELDDIFDGEIFKKLVADGVVKTGPNCMYIGVSTDGFKIWSK